MKSLQNAADLAGLDTEQKQIALAIQEAEIKNGGPIEDSQRRQIENAITLRHETEDAQAAAKKYADDLQRTSDRIAGDLSRALGDQFFAAFKGESQNAWEAFKDYGLRALANLTAELATSVLRPFINSVAGIITPGPGVAGAAGATGLSGASGAGASVGGVIAAGSGGGLGTLGGGFLGAASAGLGVLRLLQGGSLTQGLLLGGGATSFLSGAFGDAATASIGNSVSAFTSPLASIGGFAVSTLLSQLGIGNNTGGQIGSVVGGIGGSIAGTALLGTVLGSFAGPVGADRRHRARPDLRRAAGRRAQVGRAGRRGRHRHPQRPLLPVDHRVG